MLCNMEELCRKEVINICNGNRIGYIRDVNIETETAQICSLIVEPVGFVLFKKKHSNHCIPWNAVRIIGKETVLVQYECIECDEQHQIKGRFSFFKR